MPEDVALPATAGVPAPEDVLPPDGVPAVEDVLTPPTGVPVPEDVPPPPPLAAFAPAPTADEVVLLPK